MSASGEPVRVFPLLVLAFFDLPHPWMGTGGSATGAIALVCSVGMFPDSCPEWRTNPMLAGRIPTEIGLLSQLTYLDASNNQLPGAWRGNCLGLFADQMRWQAPLRLCLIMVRK